MNFWYQKAVVVTTFMMIERARKDVGENGGLVNNAVDLINGGFLLHVLSLQNFSFFSLEKCISVNYSLFVNKISNNISTFR